MIKLLADTTLQLASQRVAHSWPWYIVRGAGFAAAGLLILLMLSGIGMVTGLTYRFMQPLKAWVFHRAMGIALLVAIALHIIFLLVDHVMSFSLAQVFVPFLSTYNNKTTLLGLPLGKVAVTLGIVAMYGTIVVVLSSLGWINTKKTAWRWLHYLSYIVMLFVFIHALYTGSDVKYGSFRLIWILLLFVVLVGVVSRLRRSGTLRSKGTGPTA